MRKMAEQEQEAKAGDNGTLVVGFHGLKARATYVVTVAELVEDAASGAEEVNEDLGTVEDKQE